MSALAKNRVRLKNGYTELAELLIDHGADTEIKNDDGDTPLMLAVRSEHAAVVDLLCKRGCNLHTHGFDNIDPIDYAINKRNLFLSDVLMKHERQQLNSAPSGNDDSHKQVNVSQQDNHASSRSHLIESNTTRDNNSRREQLQSLNDSVFQSD